MFILDSNTTSDYFRGDAQVVPRLQALRPADLAVPAIVEYKLRYGLLRLPSLASAPRLAAMAKFLQPLQLLPFDSECATHAARFRFELQARGTPIGSHDTFIAATIQRWSPAISENFPACRACSGLTGTRPYKNLIGSALSRLTTTKQG